MHRFLAPLFLLALVTTIPLADALAQSSAGRGAVSGAIIGGAVGGRRGAAVGAATGAVVGATGGIGAAIIIGGTVAAGSGRQVEDHIR